MKNLTTRTVFGIVFVIIILSCLLLNKFLFGALALFMIAGMMKEFFAMSVGKQYRISQILAIVSGLTLFCLCFAVYAYDLRPSAVALVAIPLFALICCSIFTKDRKDIDKFAYLFTALVYIALPLSMSNAVVFDCEGEFSGIIILSFFIIIWCSDIGAYVIGTAFGQKENSKKLCPEISPKKSWVGFWGGLFFSVLAGVILYFTHILDFTIIHCIILSILIHIGGVVGDLFESGWKRKFGKKDSGNIIPGHGGLLDRFDSTLVAMPLGAIYLFVLGLI